MFAGEGADSGAGSGGSPFSGADLGAGAGVFSGGGLL